MACARTMADVDEGEDAEIRHLERGAADDDAGGLLIEAAALLDGTRGVVRKRKSARREGQDPENLIDICTVGKGWYVGMELNVYEYPATNLSASYYRFYMSKEARKKFPLLEHYQHPRTAQGLPMSCKIRLKEEMLFANTLLCANPACRRGPPSVGHGTLHYVIDSTTEEEPSKTARMRHGFHAKKIAEGKAQILCKDCELKKTCQASPKAQGSTRPRVVPL